MVGNTVESIVPNGLQSLEKVLSLDAVQGTAHVTHLPDIVCVCPSDPFASSCHGHMVLQLPDNMSSLVVDKHEIHIQTATPLATLKIYNPMN
jgi:hypothetical protein